jgi:hypothetical protein
MFANESRMFCINFWRRPLSTRVQYSSRLLRILIPSNKPTLCVFIIYLNYVQYSSTRVLEYWSITVFIPSCRIVWLFASEAVCILHFIFLLYLGLSRELVVAFFFRPSDPPSTSRENWKQFENVLEHPRRFTDRGSGKKVDAGGLPVILILVQVGVHYQVSTVPVVVWWSDG